MNSVLYQRELVSPGMTPSVVKPGLRVASELPALDVLINRWQMTMRAEGLAERTVEQWPATVLRAGRATGQDPREFTADGMRTWLAGFTNANTRATYYRGMAAWHMWLRAEGYQADDPMLLMRRPRKPKGIPHPVSTIGLYRVLEATTDSPRTRAMVVLAAYVGLRVHEIAKVRGDDIDPDAETLRVTGKGGVVAELPLAPIVLEVAAVMPSRGPWFPSPQTGRPIRAESVSLSIRRAMTKAGVRGTAHSLRHWFGTNLVRGGTDIRTVQDLMRHCSLATTQVYLEVADQARSAAVLRLPRQPGPSD